MTPISTAVRTASQRNTCRYRRSSWAACSAKWDDAALCVAMGELLQEVDEREDEDPDQVHEVPVEGGDLDLAVALGGVLAEERADENRAEVHDAREDVQPVEAREDEEGGAEEILADRLPLVEDELVPLVGLEREKDRAAEHREQEEAAQLRLVAVADAGERFHHRDAAAHEQERHEGGELDPQDRRRPRPGGIAIAQRPVGREQATERHGVGGEEDPHAELAPALRGERGLGRLDVEVVFGYGDGRHVRPPPVARAAPRGGAPTAARSPRRGGVPCRAGRESRGRAPR